MPLDVPEEELMELFQAQIPTQMARHGHPAVFEAWHEVARASRLDANAVKAQQLARIEARLWVQRSDMYTDAIYYENEQSGKTRWEPPQYWADEQRQRQNMRIDDVPRLKLPPI
ncbi:WW domain [Phytophthora cactorum]|nr:WW domain [Phytophthora cactorum]